MSANFDLDAILDGELVQNMIYIIDLLHTVFKFPILRDVYTVSMCR